MATCTCFATLCKARVIHHVHLATFISISWCRNVVFVVRTSDLNFELCLIFVKPRDLITNLSSQKVPVLLLRLYYYPKSINYYFMKQLIAVT